MGRRSSIGALSLLVVIAGTDAARAQAAPALRLAAAAPAPARQSHQALPAAPPARPAGPVDLRYRGRDLGETAPRRDLAADPRQDKRYGPETPAGLQLKLRF